MARTGNAGTARQTGELIDGIYAAADTAESWSGFLTEAGRHLDADAVSLERVQLDEVRVWDAEFGGVPESVARVYLDRWAPHNPLIERTTRAARAGELAVGSRMVASDELVGSPYYSGFLRPLGLRFASATCIDLDDSQAWLLGLLRREERGAFAMRPSSATVEMLSHLRRAIRIRRRLEHAEQVERTLNGLVEAVGRGVVVLDGDGDVQRTREAARRFLEHRPGRGVFERALGRARTSVGQPVEVSRWTSSELLCRFFGLTTCEARVALGLPEAKDVRDLAANLGVAYQTARTHLRRIYAKTGARCQRDLVRLVMALPVECAGS